MYNHKFLATKMSQNKSITKSVTGFLPSFDLGRNMSTYKYSFGRHFVILRNQFSIFYKIVTFDGLTSFLLQRLKFREIYLQFSLKSWRSTFWQVFFSKFWNLEKFLFNILKNLDEQCFDKFSFSSATRRHKRQLIRLLCWVQHYD